MMKERLRKEALAELQTIRGLMEKANVYRAISGPAALLGGFLALILTGIFVVQKQPLVVIPHSIAGFLVPWLSVLALATVVNLSLLARTARRSGETFLSPGMLAAFRALAPGLVGGGVLGLLLALGEAGEQRLPFVALLWIFSYGVALLATSSYAPVSLRYLGMAFLISAIGLALAILHGGLLHEAPPARTAHTLMGSTFGILHLGYGVAVVLQRSAEPDPKIDQVHA